jgi:gas vesicle protein
MHFAYGGEHMQPADRSNAMNEVRKSVQDAAYAAVGVGVLGAQQAAQLSQQALDTAKAQVTGAGTTAKQQADDAKVAATSPAGDARDRVEDLVHDVRERIEPVIAKVAERIEPLVDDVVAKARALLGRRAPETATKPRAA